MKSQSIATTLPVAFTVAGLLLLVGCAQSENTSARAETSSAPRVATKSAPVGAAHAGMNHAASAAAPAGELKLVADRSLVCMVNNQFMGRPQIPVEVSGRTYYGCCEMCKGRLAQDASARTSVDPVSNRSVDKASAVIAQNEHGSVMYFENQDNFAAYAARARTQ